MAKGTIPPRLYREESDPSKRIETVSKKGGEAERWVKGSRKAAHLRL